MPDITIPFDQETWQRFMIAIGVPQQYAAQERRQFTVNEIRRMVKRVALRVELDDVKAQTRDERRAAINAAEAQKRQELGIDTVVDPPLPEEPPANPQ